MNSLFSCQKPARVSFLLGILACVSLFFVSEIPLAASAPDAASSAVGAVPKSDSDLKSDSSKAVTCQLYVSPNGNDAWSGQLPAPNTEKTDGPFVSVVGARDALRRMRFQGKLKAGVPVVVTFQAGTYPQSDVVEFAEIDSGTADAPVIFQAEPGTAARISGSRILWKPQKLTDEKVLAQLDPAVRNKISYWNLNSMGIRDFGVEKTKGVGAACSGLQLICADQPQILARYPNEGFMDVAGIPDSEKGKEKEEAFLYSDERPARWVNEMDPRAAGFWKHNWAGDRIALAKIDPETRTITQKTPGSSYGFGKIPNAWYGFNLLCELDAPGEYYLNRLAGELYFYPPEGLTNPRCEVTQCTDLLQFKNVRFFQLRGLTLENCRGTALKIFDGDSVQVSRCVVRNVGQTGIELTRGQNHRVAGCDVSFTDGAGISLFACGDPKTLTHGGHVVTNCHIHHFSRRELTYSPGIGVNGCGILISHNLIHEGPHVAVLFGGRENTFEFNEIHSVCLNSGEMGAFYCGRDWTLVGNVLNGNYVHDIFNPRGQRNRAMMFDDGAAGLTVTNNLVVRVAEGISLSAVGNVIENNIFAECYPAVSCWQKWENAADDYTNPRYTHSRLLTLLEEVPVAESPWKERYPWLAQLKNSIDQKTLRAPETRTVIRGNLVWKCLDPWIQFMGDRYAYSPQTWLLEGNFTPAESASPFVSGKETDFTLRSDSEPAQKGFKPLPISQMGLFRDAERASWPVRNEVNPGCGKFTYETKRP